MRSIIFILLCTLSIIAILPLSTAQSAPDNQNPGTTPTPIDLQNLPLGDGKTSAQPQVGYIWTCQSQFSGSGAQADGPWIHADGTWDRKSKAVVDGVVEWPNYIFTIEIRGDQRVFTGNGLPDHPTGIFPIQRSDDAYQYDRNPNQISEQTLTFSIPVFPVIAAQASCVEGESGVILNGVPLFSGFDAEGRDAVAHEVQDLCNGHPEVSGQYHYHDLSGCIEAMGDAEAHSPLVAYALDGFGIYGYRGEDGKMLTNADLDECHGHTHEIEWEGQTLEMYHYHATAEFPYTVGCFRGTPVRYHFGGEQGGQLNGNPPPQGQQPPGGQPGNPPHGGQGNGNPPPPPR